MRQRGYMLITLMLALALIAIAMLAALPEIAQQIRRDQEEELRHRGSQYMRAIQHFYRKFGRYPSGIEELENTNNIHFIRKLYKDPLNRDPSTGQERDFKLLHLTDISSNNGLVLGQTAGQGGLAGQGQGGSGGAQGGFGGLQGLTGGLGAQTGGLTPPTGDSANPSSGSSLNSGSNAPASSSANSNTGAGSSSGFNGQTFGGSPILGVASTSTAKTIRVFYQKNHYNDWLFIYLPQNDVGRLLIGPVRADLPTSLAPALNHGLPGLGTDPNAGQPQSAPTQSPQTPGQTPPQD
jgi:type II secretory pathway pseudopilin PulG